MLAGELSQRLVVAGVGEHDPGVGHRRLGQHAGDVAGLEGALEGCEIVPLDRPGGHRRVDGRPDVVRPRAGLALDLDREALVDGAVVAPGIDQDLRPVRDRPRQAKRETVRVGCRESELPAGQAESPPELGRHPARVLGRQHQGDPARSAVGDGLHRRLRRVTGHCPRIPEAEIDVLVAVDILEPGALGIRRENGERTRPLGHPRHWDAAEQSLLPALEEPLRAWVVFDEPPLLLLEQIGEPVPVELPFPRHARQANCRARASTSGTATRFAALCLGDPPVPKNGEPDCRGSPRARLRETAAAAGHPGSERAHRAATCPGLRAEPCRDYQPFENQAADVTPPTIGTPGSGDRRSSGPALTRRRRGSARSASTANPRTPPARSAGRSTPTADSAGGQGAALHLARHSGAANPSVT